MNVALRKALSPGGRFATVHSREVGRLKPTFAQPIFREFYMRSKLAQLLPAAMLLVCTLSSAQGIAEACKLIITDGLREYSIKASSDASYNSVYDKYCEVSGSARTDKFGFGMDTILESIPVGFKGDFGSSSEQMKNFCKTYASKAAGRSSSTSYEETIVRRAYQSFDQCVALAAKDVVVRHSVQTMSLVDFFLAPGFDKGIKVNGVQMTPNVECRGQLPGDGKPAQKINEDTQITLSGNQTLGFRCERKGVAQAKGDVKFDEAVITIFTNLAPNGNYSVFIPQALSLGGDRVATIEGQLAALQAGQKLVSDRAEAVNARFAKVRMSQVCTKANYFPKNRPGPPVPDCPATFTDTGAYHVFSSPGGDAGYGGICRICYRVDE